MINIARDSVVSAALGAGVGYALEAKPLPYALAYGIVAAIKPVMHDYLQTTPLKLDSITRYEVICLHNLVELGGSFALASAVLHGLGLAAISSANALSAAGALTVLSLTSGVLSGNLKETEDPNTKSSYAVFPYPLVVVDGVATGFFFGNLFGANSVAIGTIFTVNSLVANTDYKLFGCIDRRFNREAGGVVRYLTSTVFALSLLKKNLLGVAGSVAFTALCAFATSSETK